jgi:hypothetical protein
MSQHGATDLIINKCDLFRDTLGHKLELELQVLTSEDCVIVLFNVCRAAFCFGTGDIS